MSTFRIETPVGRLVVAKWSGFRKAEEAETYRQAIMTAIDRIAPAVMCADWREADVVPAPVSQILLAMLSGSQTRLVRSAILLTIEHATFGLQAERLVREAGHAARRTFRNPDTMLSWLGEIITPAELEAATAFLKNESR